MTTPTMRRDDELIVIEFGDHENMTDREWVATMHELLDEAESIGGPKVLITTGTGKHYSNGLDVGYMSGAESGDIIAYVNSVEGILSRLLTFPAPTVGAINGHAFGAGAFLVLAHDYTVMREDRGFVCWPEVHLDMGFSPGLLAMIQHLLPPPVQREAIIAGPRYSAADAVRLGIVDATAPLEGLLDAAAALGRPHAATAMGSVAQIKRQRHRRVTDALGTG